MSPSRQPRETHEVIRLVVECGGTDYGDHVIISKENLVEFYEAVQTQALNRSRVNAGPSTQGEGK